MLQNAENRRFGSLTVISLVEEFRYPNGERDCRWLCHCDCGNEIVVCGKNLRSGHTKSCGCLRRAVSRDSHTKHGMENTRLYSIWESMKQRCTNPNTAHYKNYGGRGICVCDAWLYSFPLFAEWALSNGYDDTLTLDRIDVNGNYEPENCAWATWDEQCYNKRNTLYVTISGVDYTLKQLSDKTGIDRDRLRVIFRDSLHKAVA